MTINRTLGFRRIALGTFIAALAVVTLFGNGADVGAQQNDDWGSKADFQWFCELVGGTYFESPQDRLTICVYPDGSREACDMNGGDCHTFPPNRIGGGRTIKVDSIHVSIHVATSNSVLVDETISTSSPTIARPTDAGIFIDDDQD